MADPTVYGGRIIGWRVARKQRKVRGVLAHGSRVDQFCYWQAAHRRRRIANG